MVVPNGEDEEQNNSQVSCGVTGQAYTSNGSLILYWTQFVSFFSLKAKSKLQKQDVGENTPFKKKKNPYEHGSKLQGVVTLLR